MRAGDDQSGFFSLAQWGCISFLFLLTAVAVATGVHLATRSVSPVATASGVVGPVEETRLDGWRVGYGFSFRSDAGEVRFIRLRNNGRIMHLLAELPPGSRARVFVRSGQAVTVQLLEPARPPVREHRVPVVLLPAAGLLALLLLLPLAWPRVVEARIVPAATIHRDEEE